MDINTNLRHHRSAIRSPFLDQDGTLTLSRIVIVIVCWHRNRMGRKCLNCLERIWNDIKTIGNIAFSHDWRRTICWRINNFGLYHRIENRIGCSYYLFIATEMCSYEIDLDAQSQTLSSPKVLEMESDRCSLLESVTRKGTRTRKLRRKRNYFHWKYLVDCFW